MFLQQEHFVLVCLDRFHHVIKKKTLFIGSISECVVTPKEVFQEAMSVSSAKIILCHNHPSGKCEPSPEDIFMTAKIMDLGKMLGIELLDHIIIGWQEFFSISAGETFYDHQDS